MFKPITMFYLLHPRRFHCVIVLLVMMIKRYATGEPCETYNTIDSWKRSLAYETANIDDSTCDSFLREGWYRITSGAGELMPTQCIKGGWRCGTVYPTYLSSEVPVGETIYPLDDQVVERTAYTVVGYNCTAKNYTIQIKNCTLYLVYYLKPVKGCPSGYCFGSERKCPEGHLSNTGFTPGCTDEFPDFKIKSPKIEVDFHMEIDSSGDISLTPMFKCSPNDANGDYNYDIHYYINDVLIDSAIYQNISYNAIAKSVLLQKHWENTFRPNMLVKCAIQSRFINRGVPGEKVFSDQYFAGIKVLYNKDDEYGFVVSEGELATISIQATMPIGCSYNTRNETRNKSSCYVGLYNGVPDYQNCKNTDNGCVYDASRIKCDNAASDLQFKAQDCLKKLFHTNWNDTFNIEITPRTDDKAANDRDVFLRLYSDPNSANPNNALKIWESFILPDIKIRIKDTNMASLHSPCSSSNDPHMVTFDSISWELQRSQGTEGEYIMYKHDRLPQQVNVFFRNCFPEAGAMCNCGVASRSADSLFVANFCETKNDIGQINVNRYVASRICDAQNLRVEEPASDRYLITLPSGTTIEFQHGIVSFSADESFYGIHWIYIRPSQFDHESTSGLCGKYNGNPEDDFTNKDESLATGNTAVFAKSWKVAQAESLFNPMKIPTLDYKLQQYCTCQTQGSIPKYDCNLTSIMKACRQVEIPRTVIQASCISKAYRYKRSTDINEEADDLPPMYEMTDEHVTEIDNWPTDWRNGITEEIARDKCAHYISNLPSYSACTSYVPTINATKFIEDCVLDMKIMGSDSFLTATLQSFQGSCLHDAKRIVNLTETNITSSTGESKSIFEIIGESSCPNNCSGQGTCKEGICLCTEFKHGKDCSLDKTTSPKLVREAFEEYCDKSRRPCNKWVVPGMDFNPDHLICKFRPFKVQQNNTLYIEVESFMHPGTYSSSFIMYCTLPESRRQRSLDNEDLAVGYFISVSNDGLNFTDELIILIFDARCVACSTYPLSCSINKMDNCPTIQIAATSTTYTVIITVTVVICSLFFVAVLIVVFCKQRFLSRKQSLPISNPSNYLTDTFSTKSSDKYKKRIE